RIVGIRADLLADRRPRGPPILAGEVLPDQYHSALFMNIGPGEFAAGDERRAERPECAGGSRDEAAQGRDLVGPVNMVAGGKRMLRTRTGNGEAAHETHRRHAWDPCQALYQILLHEQNVGFFGGCASWNRNA